MHNAACLGDEPASDPGGPRLSLDHPISRRGFLARGAGTAGLLSVGNLLGCQDEHYRALAGGEYQPGVLATREFAVLRAVARRMVPRDGAHPGADELGVAARIDRELGFHPSPIGEEFGLALRLVEWWPLPLRFARFTRLSAAEQDAQLSGLAGSSFSLPRSAFQGIKFFVMLFHYSQEAAWSAIGYGGPFVERGPTSTQPGSPIP
jgi:hypothetical protein